MNPKTDLGQVKLYLNLCSLEQESIPFPQEIFGIDPQGIVYQIRCCGKLTADFKTFFDRYGLFCGSSGKKNYFSFERVTTLGDNSTLEKLITFLREWTISPALVSHFEMLKLGDVFKAFDTNNTPIPYMRLSQREIKLFNRSLEDIVTALKKLLVKIDEADQSHQNQPGCVIYRPYKIKKISHNGWLEFKVSR